ncbi:MAG: tetratricopeptide repeat protein [Bacteroidales bacterium]|nr:tetratricopeptide repeat protein [Bacteroidales bacterium]MCF8386565.1 tetratricopeptide repeat protein [Bacteroidales bacterium]MCF8397778.1 tetratricopeptide repeat protein [Bacteroidales bacterium]
MENVKIYFKVSMILLMLLLSSTMLFAQQFEEVKEAFSLSYELEKEGEYSKASETMKTVYDENSYEINLRLGWLAYLSGLFTESIAYYQKAISLKPISIEARFGIAYPASSLGNWEQVINQYNKILEIDPENTYANYRLGNIYYGREDFQKAEKYFEKVVNLYPFDYDAVIMLAWTKLKLEKLREAKVLFQKTLLISPEDESAQEGLELIK